jgi:beta-lactamase regulating signal transducer with metallopeptidase domain
MLWWMLQTVLITALMAAIVWILCRLLPLRSLTRHALWLLVLIKFVAPPIVAWPWPVNTSVPMTRQLQGDDKMTTLALLRSLMVPDGTTRDGNGVQASGSPQASSLQPAAGSPMPPASDSVHPDGSATPAATAVPGWHWTQERMMAAILCFWFAGALFMLSLQAIRILRMMRHLRSSRPAELELRDHVGRIGRQIGVRPVRVLMLSTITSPYIWSFGRPTLLWPAGLPVNDALIVHELAHIRRRDHWVGWMELAAAMVWWWNPVFWSVRARLRAESELACDGWVVHTFPQGRRAYADALVAACEQPAFRGLPSLALGVRSDTLRDLKLRLTTIMTGSMSLRLSRTSAAVLILIAAVTLPAWSQQATTAPKLPFAISKETTGMTSPLNADGTPDYVAALNEKYGKGVTPENNGFALLSSTIDETFPVGELTIDKAREKAFEMLGVKPPAPTAQRWKTFGMFLIRDKHLSDAQANDLDDDFSRAMYEPWTQTEHPLEAEYLKTQQPLLEKAVEAINLPRWWSPLASRDNGTTFAILLPNLGLFRDIANNLSARAQLRATTGDFDGFVSDALAVNQLARHLCQSPMMIERLVGIAIDNIADQCIGGVVGTGKLTQAQCETLSKALAALPPLSDLSESYDIFERWNQHDFVFLLATNSSRAIDAFPVNSYWGTQQESQQHFSRIFGALERSRVEWDYVLQRQNEVADELVACMRLPNNPQGRKQNDDFSAKMDQWIKTAEGEGLLPRPGESKQAYSERVARAITGTLIGPGTRRAAEMYWRDQVIDSTLSPLLQLARAKAQTGQWPTTLANIPTALAADPYSGGGNKPFHVLITDKGARVYSIGANGIDDDGILDTQNHKDDLGTGVR